MGNLRFPLVRVLLLATVVLSGTFATVSIDGGTIASAQTGATPVAAEATPEATPVADGTPTAAADVTAWLQYGPGGTILARAISEEACPEISIDGVSYSMDRRAEPSADHPVTVCETAITGDPESVIVANQQLPLPVDNPERVLVIGDTGCRMKEGSDFQACNDPDAWPFARVAAEGAAWEPDLIIHVGDYHYREAPCPDGNEGCAGSPYGDNWASWDADFFNPVGSLLTSAPWIFLRGNHEDCPRAGPGWFRYLDPRPLPTVCLDYTNPYAVDIGDIQAIVIDTASGQDVHIDEAVTDAFRPQFAEVDRLASSGPSWLLTHRPFWTIADGDDGLTEWTNATYESANFAPPSNVEIVLAGHVHLAQLLWFTEESDRPVQMISGHGGTNLDNMATAHVTGQEIGDPAMIEGWRYKEFGFIGMERIDTGWALTAPMVDGSIPESCLIVDKSVACIP
jgi:hypothetical protein